MIAATLSTSAAMTGNGRLKVLKAAGEAVPVAETGGLANPNRDLDPRNSFVRPVLGACQVQL